MKHRFQTAPAPTLGFALLLLAFVACRADEPAGRVLLIGVDGMSPELVAAMRSDGQLPNLEAIAARGVAGTLSPELPPLSPRIWTSIATGKTPGEHGILHWVRLDDSGRPRLYSSSDRKAHALWNIASDAGLTVAVVNWLMTHPPEEVKGVMISDHAVPGGLERRRGFFEPLARQRFPDVDGDLRAAGLDISYAFPPSWDRRVQEHLAETEPLTSIENPFLEEGQPPTRSPAVDFYRVWHSDELVARTALDVLTEIEPELAMVYLPGVDKISHFFWPAIVPPENLPPERRLDPLFAELNAETLYSYYRFADALVGLLAAGYGAEDLVLVVSDHGFEAGTESGELPGVHTTAAAADGLFYAVGRDVPAAARIEHVRPVDIVPTILAWLGMPVADDMAGQVPEVLAFGHHGSVPTYDTTPIVRPGDRTSEAEESILEELRALDYIQ